MPELASTIWADGPAGAPHDPPKYQIRAWGTWLESLVNLAFTSGRAYATKAALQADLTPVANIPALVIGDAIPGNDGLYMKVGGTGTGSWTQLLDFVPGAQIVHAVDAGAGTPDAIVVTTDLAVSATGSQLIEVDVYEANTGSPVTITFPGLTAKTIKTSAGNDVAAGGLKPGPMLGRIHGSAFRLLSDQAVAAIQAACEAAQAAAETAAATALSAVPNLYVASIGALEAVDPSTHPEVYLTYPGRAGQFVWRTGDYTARVDADTAQALFIESNVIAKSLGAWERLFEGPIMAKWAGLAANLVGASGTDDSAKMQSLSDIGKLVFSEGCTIDWSGLKIYYSNDVFFSADTQFVIDGTRFYGDGAYIYFFGVQTDVTYIASAASAGARTITVANGAAIASANLVILHNDTAGSFYSNPVNSRDYRDGEFIVPQSIVGNNVTFETAIQTSYPGVSTDRVLTVDQIKVSIRGKGVFDGSGVYALRLRLCSFDFSPGMKVVGGTVASLELDQCYDFNLAKMAARHTAPAIALNYGINFASCQKGIVSDSFLHGTRHGSALGNAPGAGGVPCRDIRIERCRISNDTPALHAADIHGGAVNCKYVDCDTDGAVGLGGLNCGYSGRVKAVSTGGHRPVILTELVGGIVDLNDIEVSFGPGATATEVFGIASSSQFGAGTNVRNFHLDMNRMKVNSVSTLQYVALFLNNLPGTVRWTGSFDSMKLLGDTSGIVKTLNLTVSNTLSHGTPPICADSISHRGVTFVGTNAALLNGSALVPPTLSGTWTGCKWDFTGVSGTYTPAVTAGTNVSSTTVDPARWWVVGNVINVSCSFAATTSASGASKVYPSLPAQFASGLPNLYSLRGNMTAILHNVSGGYSADVSNNRGLLDFTAGGATTYTFSGQFSYQIS